MKINQIATALNTTIMNVITGASAVVSEDLTNIVDIGNVVLDYTDVTSGNFNNFIAGLIDQIGRVVMWDRAYTSKAPKILVESWEYGSIMMKCRVETPEFRDNTTWNLSNIWADAIANSKTPGIVDYPALDPFELSIPTSEAKFYNTKVTFECSVTITEKQLKSAFKSPEEMQRFIATIENRIRTKMILATDALIYRTVANFMGLKICNGNYIDLKSVYNTTATAAGLTTVTTLDDAMVNPDFLKFAAKTIDTVQAYIQEASVLFSDGNYISFTPEERMQFLMLKGFESSLRANLYSNTFNEEYVKLNGYQVVPDWLGTGTTVGSSDRADLKVDVDFGGTKTGVQAVVLATIFDRDGAAVCNEDPRTTSQYNGRGEYTNFFYKWDANYLNDVVENGIVFTFGAPILS